MRTTIFLLSILLIPSLSLAEELEEQINKACFRHAVSLVTKLKADVVGDLSQEKSDQALQLATDSCQAYFKKEFGQNSEAIAKNDNNNEKTEDKSKNDSFLEKIINSESEVKDGTKRIRRNQR